MPRLNPHLTRISFILYALPRMAHAGVRLMTIYITVRHAPALLRLFQPKTLHHFVVEEAFSWPIRLYPFSIDHKLRDRTLSRLPDDFFGRAGHGLDIDLAIRDLESFQKALRLPAVGKPG